MRVRSPQGRPSLPVLANRHSPAWRNWQTRRTQNAESFRTCEFESHSGDMALRPPNLADPKEIDNLSHLEALRRLSAISAYTKTMLTQEDADINSMAVQGCWAPPIEHGTYVAGTTPEGASAKLIVLLQNGK